MLEYLHGMFGCLLLMGHAALYTREPDWAATMLGKHAIHITKPCHPVFHDASSTGMVVRCCRAESRPFSHLQVWRVTGYCPKDLNTAPVTNEAVFRFFLATSSVTSRAQ